VLKESVACTYELVQLYSDALLQYDELEAYFFQSMHEQGMPWFKLFGGTDLGDDFLDVFNLDNQYRELIIQNAISVFGFRMYLFSRQVNILCKLNSPVEILRRTDSFIRSFSTSFDEYAVILSHH
jgi:hypothetical protein